jgi:hypothetical protein
MRPRSGAAHGSARPPHRTRCAAINSAIASCPRSRRRQAGGRALRPASAELYGHAHTARRQANLPAASNGAEYKPKRAAVTAASSARRRRPGEPERPQPGLHVGVPPALKRPAVDPDPGEPHPGKALAQRLALFRVAVSRRRTGPCPMLFTGKAARRTPCPGTGQNSSLFETGTTRVARRATPPRPSSKSPVPAAGPAATSPEANCVERSG